MFSFPTTAATMIIKSLCGAVLALSMTSSFATTWDEPWHHTVVQRAHTLGLFEVKKVDGDNATLVRKKHLAGEKTPEQFTTSGYSNMQLRSASSEKTDVWLKEGKLFYLLLEKAGPSSWKLQTPAAGSDFVAEGGKVHATYSISMHKALMDASDYELTQICIFNVAHRLPCDRAPVEAFIKTSLTRPPISLGEKTSEQDKATFFAQHAALRTAAEIGYQLPTQDVERFLQSPSMFQQMSGLRYRAVNRTNLPAFSFAAFMCDRTKAPLARQYALHLMVEYDMRSEADGLRECAAKLPEGDGKERLAHIMDPRIGTRFPYDLKQDVGWTLANWQKK